jgi:hypothetical protein
MYSLRETFFAAARTRASRARLNGSCNETVTTFSFIGYLRYQVGKQKTPEQKAQRLNLAGSDPARYFSSVLAID